MIPTRGCDYIAKVQLPLPPNRANARGHWATINKDKLAYEREAWLEIRNLKLDLPVRPAIYMKWRAHFCVVKEYDADNLVSLCKWPLDCLVQFKVIKDDSPRFAWPSSFPTQEIVKKKDAKLILDLELWTRV